MADRPSSVSAQVSLQPAIRCADYPHRDLAVAMLVIRLAGDDAGDAGQSFESRRKIGKAPVDPCGSWFGPGLSDCQLDQGLCLRA